MFGNLTTIKSNHVEQPLVISDSSDSDSVHDLDDQPAKRPRYAGPRTPPTLHACTAPPCPNCDEDAPSATGSEFSTPEKVEIQITNESLIPVSPLTAQNPASPSKWRTRQPRPTPIIPVDPHYDLMKTPLTTPPLPESPPSYNLQTYEPPRRDPTRMWAAKTGSCSIPSDMSSAPPTLGHKPKASPPSNLTLTRTTTRTPTQTPTPTSGRMTVRNLGPVPRQPPPTPPTIRAPQNGTGAATTLEWDGR